MSNSIRNDRPRRMMRAPLLLIAAALTAAGCSPPGEAADDDRTVAPAPQASAAAPAPVRKPPTPAGSRIIAKQDFVLRGKPACRIGFAYAGHLPEDLFWEEPCAAVTAQLMTQAELEALGRWDRLDEFARKFVNALPEGRVLYVGGSFAASVYPIGTTGETYEVTVAD
jgi:hypothetical protein